jgi:bifunctional DNA-binding transcriptional regulator/antitoxin component of YhaV-PrlF toxin-antitoxin module
MTTIQINKRGTLTLPKEYRKMLGLEQGGVVMAESTEKGLLLKPALAFPIELYSESRVAEFDEEDNALGKYLEGKKRKK